MKHFIGNFLLMTVLGGETFMYRINLSPALHVRGHASCCTDSPTQSPETRPGWRLVVCWLAGEWSEHDSDLHWWVHRSTFTVRALNQLCLLATLRLTILNTFPHQSTCNLSFQFEEFPTVQLAYLRLEGSTPTIQLMILPILLISRRTISNYHTSVPRVNWISWRLLRQTTTNNLPVFVVVYVVWYCRVTTPLLGLKLLSE